MWINRICNEKNKQVNSKSIRFVRCDTLPTGRSFRLASLSIIFSLSTIKIERKRGQDDIINLSQIIYLKYIDIAYIHCSDFSIQGQ